MGNRFFELKFDIEHLDQTNDVLLLEKKNGCDDGDYKANKEKDDPNKVIKSTRATRILMVILSDHIKLLAIRVPLQRICNKMS